LKLWINGADEMMGNSPRFGDVAGANIAAVMPTTTIGNGNRKYGPGVFFNKPLASAVKQIMGDRFEANEKNPAPISVDAIHDYLSEGSFSFETSGIEQQKNSIRISLVKNSVTFVKLPGSDLFGLVEWYGKRAPRRRAQLALPVEEMTDDQLTEYKEGKEYFTGEAEAEPETETTEQPVTPILRRI